MGKLTDENKVELVNRKKEAIKKLPQYRGEVMTKNNIRNLKDLQVGSIFWVESEEKPFIVEQKNGKKITIKVLDEEASISTGITIFEMNKRMIAEEPLFDWNNAELVEKLNKQVAEWIVKTGNTHYMLYGVELNYLTLFKAKAEVDGEAWVKEIFEQIGCIGAVISLEVDANSGDKVEIWIRTNDSAAELLYLFPYDRGVVEV